MKLHRLLILSGLLIGTAPSVSYAGCATACTLPEVCRITSQGPPTVYGCGSPNARVVGAARSSGGVLTAKQGSGNVMGNGSTPDSSTARTTGPKNSARPPAALKLDQVDSKTSSITSPRDAASGLPSARRNQPQ
jgi:hypothetical protein